MHRLIVMPIEGAKYCPRVALARALHSTPPHPIPCQPIHRDSHSAAGIGSPIKEPFPSSCSY